VVGVWDRIALAVAVRANDEDLLDEVAKTGPELVENCVLDDGRTSSFTNWKPSSDQFPRKFVSSWYCSRCAVTASLSDTTTTSDAANPVYVVMLRTALEQENLLYRPGGR